jgi:hypothetical protein
VYYVKGTLHPKGLAPGASSSDKWAAGAQGLGGAAAGNPRPAPGPAAKGSSGNLRASAKAALPTGVPWFGGSDGHRSYFHAEALERGLRRANATLAKLGESTGKGAGGTLAPNRKASLGNPPGRPLAEALHTRGMPEPCMPF